MATIVRHKELDILFALVGSGFSANWRPTMLGFGPLATDETDFQMAICTTDGKLRYANADELEVVSIDGRPVAELFARETAYRGA